VSANQEILATDIGAELAGITVDPAMNGLLDFTVKPAAGSAGLTDLDPNRDGIQTRIVIELPAAVTADTYYKIGKTPDNPTPHVYAYMADGDPRSALWTKRQRPHKRRRR